MNLEVKSYPVIKRLQGIVRNIWQVKACCTVNHTLLPAKNSDIIINLSSPIVYGEETTASVHINGIRRRHSSINQNGYIDVIGLTLDTAGLYLLTGIPSSEITDRSIDSDLISTQLGNKLTDEIRVSTSEEERIGRVQNVIFEHMNKSLLPDTRTAGIIERFSSSTPQRIEKFCKDNGVSRRTLERWFNLYIGITPKEFSAIERFGKALRQIIKGDYITLTDVAYCNEYYDQMHMIKEFKNLSGVTPSSFENRKNFVKQICSFS